MSKWFAMGVLLVAVNLQQSGCDGGSIPRETVRSARCHAQPGISNCGNPGFAPGTNYQFKSVARFRDGRAICIDVATESGTFQQLDCRSVRAQRFQIGSPDSAGCFPLQQADGKIVLPEHPGRSSDDPDRYAVFGAGMPNNIAECPTLGHGYHWQLIPVTRPGVPSGTFMVKNRVTGRCIDADGSNRTERVKTLDCRPGIPNQEWTIRTPPRGPE